MNRPTSHPDRQAPNGAEPSPVTIAPAGDRWELSCSQWVPRAPEQIFPFFGTAHNLERLTPDFLRFKILDAPTAPLTTGSRIAYRLQLHGIPVRWKTRIDAWTPPRRFIDRQVSGPFRLWHHLHEFIPRDGGTLMRDTVTFDVYCRWLYHTPALGWIDGDLKRIFEYRQMQIAELFG